MALSSDVLNKLQVRIRMLSGLEANYRDRISDFLERRLRQYADQTGSTGPSIEAISSLITQIKPRTDLDEAAQKAVIELLQRGIAELENEAAEASLEPLTR